MIDIGTKVTLWIPGKRLVAVSQMLELFNLTQDFCYVLGCVPQNPYVEVPTSSTSQSEFIWK